MVDIPTYLDFVDHIEGIGIASVRKHNLVKRICKTVRGHFPMAEGISEICRRIGDSCVTTKNDEASDGDEHQSKNFDHANCVTNDVRESCMSHNDCINTCQYNVLGLGLGVEARFSRAKATV